MKTVNNPNTNFWKKFADGFQNLRGVNPLFFFNKKNIAKDLTMDLCYKNGEVFLHICGKKVFLQEDFKEITVKLFSEKLNAETVIRSGDTSHSKTQSLCIKVIEKDNYCEIIISKESFNSYSELRIKTKRLTILNNLNGDRIQYLGHLTFEKSKIESFYRNIERDESGKIRVEKLREELGQTN